MGVPDLLTGASVELMDFNTDKNTDNNTDKNTDNNTENTYCCDTEKRIFSGIQEIIGS